MLKQSIRSELSRIQEVGKAQAFGVVLDQTQGATRLLAVPAGQIFLITDIFLQAGTTGVGGLYTPNDQQIASPDLTVYGIDLVDAGGSSHPISFQSFIRDRSVFDVQDSPNWRNAPPGNIVTWRPKYPIPVPTGWTIKSSSGGDFGNAAAVYGYFLGETEANSLGYSTSTSATAANRSTGVISGSPTTSYVDHIVARVGYCIRILDINIRMQPRTGGTTNKIFLAQDDGDVIMTWTNNNPGDLLDRSFSPEIYLEEGKALQLKGSIAATASVTISFEYVLPAQVPGDAWWAYVEPDLATPTSTKVGTSSQLPAVSTQVTCFYPRRNVTKTSPTKGYQHMLHGFCGNIQKTTSVTPDQNLLTLSTGSAAGQIDFSLLGADQTNVQLMPTIAAVGHDQMVAFAMDDLNIPCKKDDGSLWVDVMTVGPGAAPLLSLGGLLTTPSVTDADVDEWSMTLWGRTIPNQFYNPENKGA